MAMQAWSSPIVHCARCGHDCSGEAWRNLPCLRVFSSDDLSACVSEWPDDRVVEVRACPRCRTPIARSARAP